MQWPLHQQWQKRSYWTLLVSWGRNNKWSLYDCMQHSLQHLVLTFSQVYKENLQSIDLFLCIAMKTMCGHTSCCCNIEAERCLLKPEGHVFVSLSVCLTLSLCVSLWVCLCAWLCLCVLGAAVDKSRLNVASLHAGRTKTDPRHTWVENVMVRSTSSVARARTNSKNHSAIVLTWVSTTELITMHWVSTDSHSWSSMFRFHCSLVALDCADVLKMQHSIDIL